MDYGIDRPGWFKAATEFSDIVAPVSNYPLAYVYAMFLAVSGHLMGRKTWVTYAGGEIFANHYVCLLGGSGTHHKSTAMNMAMKSLGDERLFAIKPIRGITTAPGLLLAMSNNRGMGFVQIDELAATMQKAGQDFGKDMTARIVELYGCPAFAGNYTRSDPVEVQYPFLTFIAASTIEWLRATISNADLMAGFGNRMSWITGDPRPEKAWPIPFEAGSMDWSPIEGFRGEVKLEEQARDLWDHFFFDFVEGQKSESPFLRTLAERLPEKVIKAALVQAAWRRSFLIDEEILEGAIDWGHYLLDTLRDLAPSFGAAEEKVLAAIGKGFNTKKSLVAQLQHEIGYEKIMRAIRALEWTGHVLQSGSRFILSVDSESEGGDN